MADGLDLLRDRHAVLRLRDHDSRAAGDGPTLIADGFGLNQPTLLADPGSVVTIKLEAAIDAVQVCLGVVALSVAPVRQRWTYTVTVPADASLPAKFGPAPRVLTRNVR